MEEDHAKEANDYLAHTYLLGKVVKLDVNVQVDQDYQDRLHAANEETLEVVSELITSAKIVLFLDLLMEAAPSHGIVVLSQLESLGLIDHRTTAFLLI